MYRLQSLDWESLKIVHICLQDTCRWLYLKVSCLHAKNRTIINEEWGFFHRFFSVFICCQWSMYIKLGESRRTEVCISSWVSLNWKNRTIRNEEWEFFHGFFGFMCCQWSMYNKLGDSWETCRVLAKLAEFRWLWPQLSEFSACE